MARPRKFLPCSWRSARTSEPPRHHGTAPCQNRPPPLSPQCRPLADGWRSSCLEPRQPHLKSFPCAFLQAGQEDQKPKVKHTAPVMKGALIAFNIVIHFAPSFEFCLLRCVSKQGKWLQISMQNKTGVESDIFAHMGAISHFLGFSWQSEKHNLHFVKSDPHYFHTWSEPRHASDVFLIQLLMITHECELIDLICSGKWSVIQLADVNVM